DAGGMAKVFLDLYPELSEILGLSSIVQAIESPISSSNEEQMADYISLIEGIKAWARLISAKPYFGREAWHQDLLFAVFALAFEHGFVNSRISSSSNVVAAYQKIFSNFLRASRRIIGHEITRDELALYA